jgi:hypothetical protein
MRLVNNMTAGGGTQRSSAAVAANYNCEVNRPDGLRSFSFSPLGAGIREATTRTRLFRMKAGCHQLRRAKPNC